MSDDHFPHDALVHCLDAAAEQMRAANHQTYTAREVTDLYPVLGALHTLFSRFDQLAGYLLRTVRDADATDAVNHAWAELGHLALDLRELVCPECGEPAHRGTPTDLTPTQRTAGIRPRYRHADGTQLCPVVGTNIDGTAIDGTGGYQPASPHAPDSPSPIASPIHRDEPDPEGQH